MEMLKSSDIQEVHSQKGASGMWGEEVRERERGNIQRDSQFPKLIEEFCKVIIIIWTSKE